MGSKSLPTACVSNVIMQKQEWQEQEGWCLCSTCSCSSLSVQVLHPTTWHWIMSLSHNIWKRLTVLLIPNIIYILPVLKFSRDILYLVFIIYPGSHISLLTDMRGWLKIVSSFLWADLRSKAYKTCIEFMSHAGGR